MAADLEARAAPSEPMTITIEPENAAAVRLFLALQTQWIINIASGIGGAIMHRSGLRYEAVPVAAGALGVLLNEETFTALRILEAHALNFFAERKR